MRSQAFLCVAYVGVIVVGALLCILAGVMGS